jgi:hypothetical protein
VGQTNIDHEIERKLKNFFIHSMDLIVLREIVTSISGVESSTDLTQDHLDALCGGDTLRGEVKTFPQ